MSRTKSYGDMIFHFKILSQEHKNFQLEVQLTEYHTFFDFHSILQKSLGYESHQLASFFIADNKGLKKEKEISMLDLGMNGGVYYIMQKTALSKLIYTRGQKLIYTFDFLNDRSLLIELTDIIMERNLSEPLVTLKRGDTPQQVLGEDVDIIEQDSAETQEEKTHLLFGELEDYTEIYGEMDDF